MSKKGRRPDSTLRSPYASHPGYDQDWQPYSEPVPRRVKSAAESNYIRNRGTMELFLDHTHPRNEGYESARPLPKARTDLAMNILNRSVNGSLGSLLGKSSRADDEDYYEAQPQQRVKGAAIEIAEKNRGQMDDMIGSGACFCPAPPPSRFPVPRIKSAAMNTAEMSRGGAAKMLFHSYGKLEPEPPPAPRVKPQAEETANNAIGKIGRLFAGNLTPPAPLQPRVRPVAQDNMKIHQGAMHNLMRHGGYTPKGYSYYNQLSDRSNASDRPSSSMM